MSDDFWDEYALDADTVDIINSAIIFGRYGVGKTLFAASANEIEDYSPVLIVDVEGSATGVGRVFNGVKVIKADSYGKLEKIRKKLREDVASGNNRWKTVIFDTLNVAQDRATDVFKKKPENINNRFGVWADLKDWTVDFVREQHAAPYTAIFTAHPKESKDENTGRITTTLDLSGSALQIVPTIVDLVAYLDIEDDGDKPIRVLRADAASGIITKNRFGLPEVLFPPKGKKYIKWIDLQESIMIAKENIEE